MGTEANSKRGIHFFQMWSEIVREGRKRQEGFPLTVKVPKESGKAMPEADALASSDSHSLLRTRTYAELGALIEGGQKPRRTGKGRISLSFAPPEYHPLLTDQRFTPLLSLLADEDLGDLMQIPYPAQTAEKVAKATEQTKDAAIVREAVALQVG